MALSFQNKIKQTSTLSFADKVTPVQQTQPTPLDPSTKATQSTFPATGNENIGGIAAKTIGNMPSSAIGFVKGTFDFLNPLNTLKTISQIPGAIKSTVDAYGGNPVKAAFETLKAATPQFGAGGDIGAAAKTVLPQFLVHTFQGDFQKAAATIENDPIGQIAPLLFLGKAAADRAGVGAQFDQAINTIASPVTKTASAIGSEVKNIAGGITKFGASQLTGLSPGTLEQAKLNPQQFSKDAQSTVTRSALAENISTALKDRQTSLSDTGAGYAGIKTLTEPVPVDPTYLDRLITSTTGLDVADGKITTKGSSSIRLPSDVNALQTKLYNTWQPEFAKGYLTPEEFLNFRSDLSKMVYNDSGIGKSTDLANLSSIMRAKVNTELRPNIPGLEQVDSAFAPQISEIKQLEKGLVDSNGNLTDSAINRIANATGKGKDPQLARLEQLSPGITDKIKILKAVEDIQNSRENKPGTYTRAAVGVGGLVTLNPFLMISAILSLPEIAIPLMRGLGYSSEMISKTLGTLGIKSATNNLRTKGGTAVLNTSVGATAASNQKSKPQQ